MASFHVFVLFVLIHFLFPSSFPRARIRMTWLIGISTELLILTTGHPIEGTHSNSVPGEEMEGWRGQGHTLQ
jgi:hypothetical protein